MKFKFWFQTFLLILIFNSTNPFFIKNTTDYNIYFSLHEWPSNKLIKDKNILPGNTAEIIYDETKTFRFQFYIEKLGTFVKFPENIDDKKLKQLKFLIIDTAKELKKGLDQIQEILSIPDPLKKLISEYAIEHPVKIIQDKDEKIKKE